MNNNDNNNNNNNNEKDTPPTTSTTTSTTTKKRPRNKSTKKQTTTTIINNNNNTTSKAASNDIPQTSHYEVSYMHKSILTCCVTSPRHGFVLTGSADGVVKFWKRVSSSLQPSFTSTTNSTNSSSKEGEGVSSKCLEFVKSYTSHIGRVSTLVVSLPHGDVAASVGGEDGVIKFYDVRTFDVSGMIKTKKKKEMLLVGCKACFVGKEQNLLAVSCREDDSKNKKGAICIYSSVTLSPKPVVILRMHAAFITAMGYNYVNHVAISCDVEGIVEVWDCHSSSSSSLDMEEEEEEDDDGETKKVTTTTTTTTIGSAPTAKHNGITYKSKFDTDLYALLQKKTFCVSLAISPKGTHFILFGNDRKVRLYEYASCKIVVTYDERERVYDALVKKNSSSSKKKKKKKKKMMGSMDAIEYGKRAALEREIDETPIMSGGIHDHSTVLSTECSDQSLSIQFDSTGRFVLLPTLLGIKLIDTLTHKLVNVLGKSDASTLRFVNVTFCGGDAVLDAQMILARTGGSSAAVKKDEDKEEEEKKKRSDALVIALAYKKRRLFVFSHFDPLAEFEDDDEDDDDDDDEEEEEDDYKQQQPKKKKKKQTMTMDNKEETQKAQEQAILSRDILNEAPDAEDLLLSNLHSSSFHPSSFSTTPTTNPTTNQKYGKEAILRTTMGDVHIKLFTAMVPKTIENFCVHATNGYYDNVLFHRIIKGFMIQTGDPLGDGTGGESIWGGEFEDEFVRDLRHDRPFTVSMANAGPNTNGSQFFITTVPTPWLDQKHTVFGRVVRGMDVCSSIENVKTDDLDRPLDDVTIVSVDIVF